MSDWESKLVANLSEQEYAQLKRGWPVKTLFMVDSEANIFSARNVSCYARQ